jgi:hypothetical protein
VDLVSEDDDAAQAAQDRAGRRLQGREDVGRAVGAGHGRVAHRSRHHDGFFTGVQQVEQVRGLLDRVRALGYHRSGGRLLRDRGGKLSDVADSQGRAGYLPEVVDVDCGAAACQPWHRFQQLLPGQRRGDAAGVAGLPGHGDGAPEGEQRDAAGRSVCGGHPFVLLARRERSRASA